MTEAQGFDRAQFREVVRDPRTHALILGQYRVGEWAGVVGLGRLLDEMEPEGNLRRAMEIHHRDEERHTRVFTDWIQGLGIPPAPLPTDVEAFFARSPEEHRQHRAWLDQLPAELRRLFIFAAINAVERLAYTQFEVHRSVLDRPGDVETLAGVMAEEKFHISYVEAELERQMRGPYADMVTAAVEGARVRFADFQEQRRAETREAIERLRG